MGEATARSVPQESPRERDRRVLPQTRLCTWPFWGAVRGLAPGARWVVQEGASMGSRPVMEDRPRAHA